MSALGSLGLKKETSGIAPMQYPVANTAPPKQANQRLEQFIAAAPDPFKSMNLAREYGFGRRKSVAEAPEAAPPPRRVSVRESRKELQKGIEARVAKTRMVKLSRSGTQKGLSGSGFMQSNTAQSVKGEAKKSANAPRIGDCKTLPAFLNLLHRKSLTLQGQRDVFKWIGDFCTANKHTDSSEEGTFERFKGQSRSNGPVHISSAAQHASSAAEKYRRRILEKCEDKLWMTHPGPVGDIPVHLAFLFGEHDLGKEMIERAVSSLSASCSEQLQYQHDLINTAYSSDLEWWFDPADGGEPFREKLKQLAKAGSSWTTVRREALCTVGCDRDCVHCMGRGGKDGGLFTGETLLHIAIVQHQVNSVEWLLENGAFLHARARGLFFQPQLIEKFDSEKTYWQLRDQIVNQLGGSCYYGEYPLSFAAAVGDVHVCHLLVTKAEELLDDVRRPGASGEKKHTQSKEQARKLVEGLEEWLQDNVCQWEETKRQMEARQQREADDGGDLVVEALLSAFVNMRDARGNTALHMAVMYEKIKTVDWLLDNGAEPSMRMLNNLHLTPLTLAVRQNSVEIFQHLASKLQTKAWAYGSVVMTITNLEQIDTFRIQPKPCAPGKPCTDGLQFRPAEATQSNIACSLHADPYWRSALEVVVQNEIHAFHATPIFQQLVEEKWLKFARWNYILYNICPYAIFVAFSSVCLWARAELIVRTLEATMRQEVFEEEWDSSRWAVAGVEFVVYCAGIPFLLLQAWRSKRLGRLDFDPNEDLEMSTEEIIFFLHKNASLMLNTAISAILLCIGILRLQGSKGTGGWNEIEASGPWQHEMNLLAVVIMLIWCNFLHQLLPFKFVGPLLVTVWRMLIGDVTRWCIVFIFILVGFSQSIAILSNALQVSGDLDAYQAAGLQFRPDEPERSIRSWTFMIDYIYVSMGEVGQDFIEDHRDDGGSLILTLHILFIILSTLLLLNLLIALMGNTLATETSNEGFAKWWMLQAEIILRFESQLSEKARAKYRSGEPNGQIEFEERKHSEYFRVLVGPDDDLDNDWGDAKPLTNEEVKANVDEQFEEMSEVLFLMFHESNERFESLQKKVDNLASVAFNASDHARRPSIARRQVPHQPLLEECHEEGADDVSRRQTPPNPADGEKVPTIEVGKAAIKGSALAVPNGVNGSDPLASPRTHHNAVQESAVFREPQQPAPPAAQPHTADTAPSMPLPSRQLRPLRPLPNTHQLDSNDR